MLCDGHACSHIRRHITTYATTHVRTCAHTHTWTALRVASLLHYVGVVAVARGAVAWWGGVVARPDVRYVLCTTPARLGATSGCLDLPGRPTPGYCRREQETAIKGLLTFVFFIFYTYNHQNFERTLSKKAKTILVLFSLSRTRTFLTLCICLIHTRMRPHTHEHTDTLARVNMFVSSFLILYLVVLQSKPDSQYRVIIMCLCMRYMYVWDICVYAWCITTII